MPEKTDAELKQAILDADKPEAFVAAIHAFYRNPERVGTERELLVLHLGMAVGMIQRMLDAH